MTTRTYLLTVGFAAALGTTACRQQEAPPSAAAPVRALPVRTSTVETRELQETLLLTGTLEPRARVTVASEVPARLERVLVNEGDRVAAGQLVAVLDATDFRLARDRAKAAVDVAEASRVHARAEQDRADSLLKTGGITDKDHLAARLAVQIADASYAQATSELAIADRQLGRTQVMAPIAGRIAKRHADAGTMVSGGTPLYLIVDDSVLDLRSSVASGDMGRVTVGAHVAVTVDALPGLAVDGRVDRIVPEVDARSRAFEAVVRVPGRRELVSGLFARGSVEVRRLPNSLVIPPNALVRDGADRTRAIAYVVSGGRVERRDVVLGVEVPDAVQVTDGLKAGESVVVDPPSALVPGTAVDVQSDAKVGA